MQLRNLGSTDLRVSPLCLGTMQFGWTADEAASFAVMDAFWEAGGNFFDSADVYSRWAAGNPGGVSEEIIGRWLKARGNRADVIIATKVRGRMWSGADGEGLGRAHIQRAVEDSLRRLQVETIDLYQCHHPDDGTPIEETLAAFQELIDAGKVRYVGLSNYTVAQVSEALTAGAARGLPRFISLQPHYNLVHRGEFEAELAKLCVEQDLAVIPYSPLGGGFLTGKYGRGRPSPKSERADNVQRYFNDKGFTTVERLGAIAIERGATMAAVALAWLLAKPGVTAPITGANTPSQLAELLPAVDLELTAAEVESLDTVSAGM